MKIVCDADVIREELKKIDTAIEDMSHGLTKYKADVATSLKPWTGQAKDKFIESDDILVEKADTHVSDLQDSSVFVSNAVTKIEDLEEKLAAIQI